MKIKHIVNIDFNDEYITIDGKTTVFTLSKKMHQVKRNIDEIDLDEALFTPILSAYIIQNGKPVGYVDRETIIDRVIMQGRDPKKTKLKEIMEPPVIRNINTNIKEVINLIIEKGLMTVGVTENEKFIGVISVYDAIFLNHITENNKID